MRKIALLACLFAIASVGLTPSASAQYGYGGYSTGGSGFFVFAEGGATLPRNTDNVVATQRTLGALQETAQVRPDWDAEVSGRFGFGYSWDNGNKLTLSGWSWQAEQRLAGDGPAGGFTDYAIGPPIVIGGTATGASGSPGYYDINTDLTATSGELMWSRSQEISDNFSVEWAAGLRYALYEEEQSGFYDDAPSTGAQGINSFAALKTMESEMFGVKIGVQGSYRVVDALSIGAILGFSQMEGEIIASSSLAPAGIGNGGSPATLANVADDGRSGQILDSELRLTWHSQSDRFRIWGGFEQSRWEGVPEDLVRNFPGTASPLTPRDEVSFATFKLGGSWQF